MDKWGWFFGWVGVAALVLCLPLTVLGNLLTPRIREWWGRTTENRALNRFAWIQGQVSTINYFDQHPSDALGECLQEFWKVAGYGGCVFVSLIFMMLSRYPSSIQFFQMVVPSNPYFCQGIALGLSGALIYFCFPSACVALFDLGGLVKNMATVKACQERRGRLAEEAARLLAAYSRLRQTDDKPMGSSTQSESAN